MEMMWGIKNPMHSLVPQELKVLTKEECLPMSKGMEMVLPRHKFDVKPEMVRVEYETYAGVARKMEGKTHDTGPENSADETCMHFVVDGSGHHLMMDAHWEECATCIVRWLESESLVS